MEALPTVGTEVAKASPVRVVPEAEAEASLRKRCHTPSWIRKQCKGSPPRKKRPEEPGEVGRCGCRLRPASAARRVDGCHGVRRAVITKGGWRWGWAPASSLQGSALPRRPSGCRPPTPRVIPANRRRPRRVPRPEPTALAIGLRSNLHSWMSSRIMDNGHDRPWTAG